MNADKMPADICLYSYMYILYNDITDISCQTWEYMTCLYFLKICGGLVYSTIFKVCSMSLGFL